MASLLTALLALLAVVGGMAEPVVPERPPADARALEAAEPMLLVAAGAGSPSADDWQRAATVLRRRLDARGQPFDVRVDGSAIEVRAVGLARARIATLLAPRAHVAIHAWEPMKMRVYRTRREALADSPRAAPAIAEGTARVVTGDAATMATGTVMTFPTDSFPEGSPGHAVLFGLPPLTTEHFRHAYVGPADTTNRTWSVIVELEPSGARQFERLTRELASDGARAGQPEGFAVIVGDRVASVAIVDYTMYPIGIRGGAMQVVGLRSKEAARRLASMFATGDLPFELRLAS